MDRLLASPVRRGAMMIETLAYRAVTTVAQTLVVFGIALLTGARFAGGLPGVAITLVSAVLICIVVASLSNVLACCCASRRLIGISQFLVLPLQFVSSAIRDTRLVSRWVQTSGEVQPGRLGRCGIAQRAVGRAAVGGGWPRLGALAVLAGVMAWLATRAFRSYQRSM